MVKISTHRKTARVGAIFIVHREKSRKISFLDECTFHPGAPIFHDAYKFWSCCNKKSVDFTEFLNFKGCTSGKHSNEKPVEPEKKVVEVALEAPQPVTHKPVSQPMFRPDFESPLTTIEPNVNAAFKKQIDNLDLKKTPATSDGSIAVGTSCKRGGCNYSYESKSSDDTVCVHHPGVPVFHEGYKFWSCCEKKTSDFTAFLGQVGCETGKHKWIQDEQASLTCRWDWHQTASNVVVTVYAKQYDYKTSFVKVNPVRLVITLVFPQQNNAEFNIDLELRGLIDVSKTTAGMFGTKLEVTMPKAEGGQWVKLDFPRGTPNEDKASTGDGTVMNGMVEEINKANEADEAGDDSDVDLDDLDVVQGAKITELGELAKNNMWLEES